MNTSPYLRVLALLSLACIEGTAANWHPSHARTDQTSNCSDRELLPLCFCSSQSSRVTDVLLARFVLSQCQYVESSMRCNRHRFYPLSTVLKQIVPSLKNRPRCLNSNYCRHALSSGGYCEACHMKAALILTSNRTRSMENCHFICQRDTSCGFLCLHQGWKVSIDCRRCSGVWKNMTCR